MQPRLSLKSSMVCQHSGGERAPKASRPRGVPGSSLLPFSLSFTAEKPAGKRKTFVSALEAWQLAYQQRISLETQSRSAVVP